MHCTVRAAHRTVDLLPGMFAKQLLLCCNKAGLNLFVEFEFWLASSRSWSALCGDGWSGKAEEDRKTRVDVQGDSHHQNDGRYEASGGLTSGGEWQWCEINVLVYPQTAAHGLCEQLLRVH